jgi:hypothetical protein
MRETENFRTEIRAEKGCKGPAVEAWIRIKDSRNKGG